MEQNNVVKEEMMTKEKVVIKDSDVKTSEDSIVYISPSELRGRVIESLS